MRIHEIQYMGHPGERTIVAECREGHEYDVGDVVLVHYGEHGSRSQVRRVSEVTDVLVTLDLPR